MNYRFKEGLAMERNISKVQGGVGVGVGGFQERDFIQLLKERLSSLLAGRRDAVAFINGKPEITRPVALEMLSFARMSIARLGGKWEEKVEVISASADYVALVFRVRVEFPNGGVFEVAEVGECAKGEKVRDALVRVAFTRAVKRVLEAMVGEDFINRLLLSSGNGRR
jgi:hypothetical protein